ncbi:preprotein translocase subunit SecA [Pseudomonas capsici]|uniref:preprotein translocase subunit SecA n=1 Tax=Pseudomonas capsici TaxID=2810614 RepID=UPI0021F19E97|nr:preprotein translocase subunit SecA [Pseudomonas capsici]MCV4263166.1 preprotein translocase subunit SecA [Pseudomonas capsici]MCV4288344.1 preprotein translocase subunit SecA [Pseudomonas capsici]
MFAPLLKKLFGSKNEREVKRMLKTVQIVNAFEEQMVALSDEQLRAKTEEFKARIAKGETLDKLLPEAFAVAREAGKRVMGMRHFDVQLIGGMTLHEGQIAEMRTGEGKTLVGTLAVYLNALSGKGVHVVTVNDYLARRDANWMRPLYEFLGLTVGIVTPFQPPEEKRAAYAADITYGTNNEFGFDYLRDNMAFSMEDKFQRELNFCVIDEVDSILIDEARTPLIISGQAEDSSRLYTEINRLIPRLERHIEEVEGQVTKPGHYTIDEKSRQVELNEAGHQFIEELLTEAGLLAEGESLYSAHNLGLLTHVYAGLRAHTLFNRNVEYIVQDGQILLVDEHTGRTMPGRRLSEGLHQAIEAKENLNIQAESQTLASTTFQNYFRLYTKLSGMTGTADTEAFEFHQIYNLSVMVIPPNKPLARKDFNDLVYLTAEEKYAAIVADIKACLAENRPVLVGTATIETSEHMSNLLKKEGIDHKVLNAKFHEKEAEIIAQAGRPGALTIATNMAGRGTDILLGGNWEVEVANLEDPTPEQIAQIKADWQKRHQQVIEAGGLHVIASERHESRRIDNQLRGRAGRQGDTGSSRFYLSLEDSLMRIFASDRVKNFMKALGMQSGEAIEHRMVTNAIEKAQRKVEGRNFDIRKQLLEFDDVANEQRKVIYHMRNSLLAATNIGDTISDFREEVLSSLISQHIPPQSLPEQWDVAGLEASLNSDFAVKLPIQQWLDEDDHLHEETLREKILAELLVAYSEKEDQASAEALRTFEKQILLRVLDDLWKDHLSTMDHLRHGIHLRGYAQKNPKQEYKRESFTLFQELLDSIKRDTIRVLSHVQVRREDPEEEEARLRRESEELAKRMQFQHAEAPGLDQPALVEDGGDVAVATATTTAPVRNDMKLGRNELCWCGSGKKFKHCHGQIG